MHITAQAPRLRNNLYCVEWDVKLYYTIPYIPIPQTQSRRLYALPTPHACSLVVCTGQYLRAMLRCRRRRRRVHDSSSSLIRVRSAKTAQSPQPAVEMSVVTAQPTVVVEPVVVHRQYEVTTRVHEQASQRQDDVDEGQERKSKRDRSK